LHARSRWAIGGRAAPLDLCHATLVVLAFVADRKPRRGTAMSRSFTLGRRRRGRSCPRPGRWRRPLLIAVSILVEAIPLWLRGYRMGGNVVVRCRDGHLFTTLWFPAASLKALRLGPWRVQRCPVGHHWSIVAPVRRSDLGKDEERIASETKDIRIP
jgi:hypothetical protein